MRFAEIWARSDGSSRRKWTFEIRRFTCTKFTRTNFLGSDLCLEKLIFANRPKRFLPKFERGRGEVRGVNGRLKFDVLRVRVRMCTPSTCVYA